MNLLTVKKLRSRVNDNYEKIARLHEAKNIQSGHYDHSN